VSALVHRDIRRLTRREGARTRDRIRDALATAGADGLTTDAVAEAVGVHPNSAREHLAQLHADGITVQSDDRSGAVGRPRRRHVLIDPAAATLDSDTAAVEMLGALVNHAELSTEVATVAGVELGRRRALTHTADTATLAGLVADQRRLGFAPQIDADGDTTCISFAACPLRAVTTTDSVCALHRGLLDGWLSQSDHQVTMLVADGDGAACHALVTAH
jgi:predicted ArsR family transcriptional regulator